MNRFRLRKSGACAVELRHRGLGGIRRSAPEQRGQLPYRVWHLMTKSVLFATPGKEEAVWATCALELLRYKDHPKAIQHMAVNMRAAYTKELNYNFANDRVVCDNFKSEPIFAITHTTFRL